MKIEHSDNDDLFMSLISKDQFEIDKMKLKLDAELLSKMLYLD